MNPTVQIDRIAAGGDGVGRLPDGMTVFVPRTAPGDAVRVSVTGKKKRWARATVEHVETASTLRATPQCPHYVADECGGCQLQHLTYEAQLDVKRRVVGDALRRLGGIQMEDPAIVPAQHQWRYRTKIVMAAHGRDTIGLHVHDRPSAIFALRDCHIVRQSLMDVWTTVMGHRHLLPAQVRRVVLREARDGRIHVVVDAPGSWAPKALSDALDQRQVRVWHHDPVGETGTSHDEGDLSPEAFDQIEPHLADTIRADVIEMLGPVDGLVAWDLYGGLGDTARLLRDRGATVVSVDADRRSHQYAKVTAPADDTIAWVTGRVEDVINRLKPAPNIVIVNPPRQGMHQRAAEKLNAMATERALHCVYQSCDPATLARDLQRMPAFKLEDCRAYDLFPQTSHVEICVRLRSGRDGGP